MTAGKIWIGIFGLWLILLSGVLVNRVGSPGILQALRLKSYLDSQVLQTQKLEEELKRLQSEARLLSVSRVAQHREIRRVLGYAAEDELVFVFDDRTPNTANASKKPKRE